MQDSRLQQAQIYTEFDGLNALKSRSRTDKEGALREVAKQFEGLFLSEMLKSMRSAGEVFSEGNYLNSEQSEFYQDMFDSQMSLTLSRERGLGLTDAMVRQLSRQIPGMEQEGVPSASHRATLADYDRSVPVLSPRLPQQLTRVEAIANSGRPPAQAGQPASRVPLPERFDSPEAFVQALLPMAEEAAADSGINPRLMVAQAALETGWGKHMIRDGDGSPSFNLFGIKADSRWTGAAVETPTTEFREGVAMSERASFRRYDDYSHSFRDYVSFLRDNPRYRDVLAAADNPGEFTQRLQDAGYATDPQYGAKIRRIMSADSFEAAADRLRALSIQAEE